MCEGGALLTNREPVAARVQDIRSEECGVPETSALILCLMLQQDNEEDRLYRDTCASFYNEHTAERFKVQKPHEDGHHSRGQIMLINTGEEEQLKQDRERLHGILEVDQGFTVERPDINTNARELRKRTIMVPFGDKELMNNICEHLNGEQEI
jgi:dTDP-4-amino-4,6-dideoxygalactose transaminase